MDECDAGGVVRSDALVNATQPCLDVEMLFEEERILLRSCLAFAKRKSAGTKPSTCVL